MNYELDEACRPYRGVFVVTDSTVDRLVMPLLADSEVLRDAKRLVIPAGEESKTTDSLIKIWEWLSAEGATRRSVLVCVGGGMITDLGGFAAATFKRGIAAIYLPTTLLAAVDASEGGKTGCNLGNLKNEVGCFAPPKAVILSALPFATLSRSEMLSGFGEMLKTGLIAARNIYDEVMRPDLLMNEREELIPLVEQCVAIKKRIVAKDPREEGLRKVLNFGHTVGHAFESLLLAEGRGVPHGIAVAHGLLAEMVVSHIMLGFPSAELYPYAEMLKDYYPRLDIDCSKTDELLRLMHHDKKNREADTINFTLLEQIGKPLYDIEVDTDTLRNALDIYRDLSL